MRIAFLTPEYPTERYFAGGLATYSRRTAKALIEKGHDPEVFTLSDTQECISSESVLVHRVVAGDKLMKRIAAHPWLEKYRGFADVLEPAWRLAMALRARHREAPFDVIQAANYRACGVIAAFWKVAPMVTRISSYEPIWREAYGIPLTRAQLQMEQAERWQLRWSSAIYAPSEFLAEVLGKSERLSVRVIEPPVYLDEQATSYGLPAGVPPPETYALFFGQVGILKGCDRIARALPRLLEQNPDMSFIFVGPIVTAENGQSFDRYVREQLAHYGKRVIVLPEQRHSVLLPIVKNARFVVLPSRIDNLPNTCLEAMLLERVVIGTRSASFEQLIRDGITGFLVSQTDDDDLAFCMNRVWNMDKADRERIGLQACRSIERLNPQNTIKQLIEFFEGVVDRQQRILFRNSPEPRMKH
jgi:glycosyltransferase involved in cell wall biosynthesis